MADDAVQRPRPKPSPVTAPFWQGCLERRLLVQRCDACSTLRFPPSTRCPDCLTDAAEWTEIAGGGEIFSFTVFHRAYHKAFADDLPYVVAIAELEQGVRLAGRLLGSDPADVAVGMRVQVEFERLGDDCAVPAFRAT